MKQISRRNFIGTSAMASMAGVCSGYGIQAQPLRLGGPIFLKTEDPQELAREHRRLGYSAAYVPNVALKDTAHINAIQKAFKEQNVWIAEVGAWVNMLEADTEKRQKNLDYVTERLALAEAVGALTCVNIGGSFNPKQWDGPDPRNVTNEYIDATVENCRKIIDAVKPKRTKFALEMMGWSLPDSPDSYLKLIKAIDRPALAAHVDIANLINSPQRYYTTKGLIEETFRKLGRWIVSSHAKDIYGKDGHFAETIPGRGGLDYAAYLRAVTSLPTSVPLMLEHLHTELEYTEGREFLLKKAGELGLRSA